MDRLLRKHRAAAQAVPAPAIRMQTDATVRHHLAGRLRSGGARGGRDAGRARRRRRLHAHPRLPLRRDGRGVPGRARSHLRRRAEPRRAAAVAADAGDRASPRTSCSRSWSTAASRCRAATWSTASPVSWSGASHAVTPETGRRPPEPAPQQARPHAARLRGGDVHAVRRLRPRLGDRRHRARVLRARHAAAHDRQAVGHRLLVEDADLLRQRRARLQLGARAHAGHRHRRRRRQPGR